MDELLQRLETEVKLLLGKHVELRHSNQQLSQGKSQLILEKDALSKKNERAITQIEALLIKLQPLVKTAE